jgi:alanyl-tRNA synthetase
VRSFGGYILHIGRLTRGEVRVGDEVHLHVDHSRRTPVLSNHTMTHAVNFALREVLGERVEQKGSLVAPDRLRFDFSHNAPVSPGELGRIESIARDMIARDLTVYTAMAPLYLARNIVGLRAVFGEKYPDPVRVVAIGQPVEDLLDNPENPAWRELSVEFCGGTHLESTGQAAAFAIVHEEGIAKGIRRIVALTGVPAAAAIRAADGIAQRIREAERFAEEKLAREVAEISNEIDQFTLPVAQRAALREELAGLQERVKKAQKTAAAERAKQASAMAVRIADSALDAGEHVIVATIDLGSDRGALQAAIGTIASKCPQAAVMLISPDDATDKVAVIAQVPDAIVARGLKAGDWVRSACETMGGKGGGKPGSAQGAGAAAAKVRDAIKAAPTEAYLKIT